VSSAAVIALVAGLAAATVIDLRTRRIPNDLTAAMVGVGLGLAATGTSGITVAASFAGFFLGLLLMVPGYTLGATGAGDVKLMGAVGAIVGPTVVVSAFLFTAIAGGLLAIIVAAKRRRLGDTLKQTKALVAVPVAAPQRIRAADRASRFAYGPAIAVGSVVAALVA
jgi:prepilin peptidase CpaA